MKKLFISQPMGGKTDEEILTARNLAIKSAEKVIGEPVETIESFIKAAPADAKPLWFLGKSLELMAKADVMYFVDGWEKARGCRIEHACAAEYGIECIEESHPIAMEHLPKTIKKRVVVDNSDLQKTIKKSQEAGSTYRKGQCAG